MGETLKKLIQKVYVEMVRDIVEEEVLYEDD